MRDLERANRHNGSAPRPTWIAHALCARWSGVVGAWVTATLVSLACDSARSAPEASPSAGTQASVPTGGSSAPPIQPATAPLRWVNYEFSSSKLGAVPALVRVPAHVTGSKLPVLVVLHGRGEAQKSPKRGARGFVDDYGLETVWQWLDSEPGARHPPAGLPVAYRHAVEAELDAAPFQGMVVVMPYLPDRFRGSEAFVNAPEYARILTELVTRVKTDLPVRQDAEGWALDGISLGGRVAMVCASHLVTHFAALGSVQAAIDERELTVFADELTRARAQNPKLHFTLATSDQDYFRLVLEHYRATLQARNLEHQWVMLPGDHSYAFNRGPGVTHLLLTYDRLLNPR